jgi:hypothetical protein
VWNTRLTTGSLAKVVAVYNITYTLFDQKDIIDKVDMQQYDS